MRTEYFMTLCRKEFFCVKDNKLSAKVLISCCFVMTGTIESNVDETFYFCFETFELVLNFETLKLNFNKNLVT